MTVALYLYELFLCSETMLSDMRHMCEMLSPGFGRPELCRMPHAGGVAAYMKDGYGAFHQPNLNVTVVKC